MTTEPSAAEPRAASTDLARVWQTLRDLVDPGECWFDHNGDCQEHGHFGIEPGQLCPHAEAKQLLAAHDHETSGLPASAPSSAAGHDVAFAVVRVELEIVAPLTAPAVGPVLDLLSTLHSESRLVAATLASGGQEVRTVARIGSLVTDPIGAHAADADHVPRPS